MQLQAVESELPLAAAIAPWSRSVDVQIHAVFLEMLGELRRIEWTPVIADFSREPVIFVAQSVLSYTPGSFWPILSNRIAVDPAVLQAPVPTSAEAV